MLLKDSNMILEQSFRRLNLKKLFWLTTLLSLFLLLVISTLGLRQYLLYRHCNNMLSTSEQLLFNYDSIKTAIAGSLLAAEPLDRSRLKEELDGLNHDVGLILDDVLIPKEIKMNFIGQLDLITLKSGLLAVEKNDNRSPVQLKKIGDQLQSISSRLHHFHKVLTGHNRSQLHGLQRVLVGTMALSLFVLTALLFLLARYLLAPIIRLADLFSQGLLRKNWSTTDPSQIFTVEQLEKNILAMDSERSRLNNLLSTLSQLTRTISEEKDDENIWELVCTYLQTNPDYIFVWLGTEDPATDSIKALTGKNRNSLVAEEWLETLDYLLKYCHHGKGLCQTVREALSSSQTIVQHMERNDIPSELLHLFESNEEIFTSISLLIPGDDQLQRILTIYSPNPDCFGPMEIKVIEDLLLRITDSGNDHQVTSDTTTASAHSLNSLLPLYRHGVVGLLSAGVAHELIDLLNGTLNYTQAVLDQVEAAETKSMLVKLYEEEHKMTSLTGELIHLTVEGRASAVPQNLSQLMKAILLLINRQLKADRIELSQEIEPGLPLTEKLADDLHLVLLSLLFHSRGAMLEQSTPGSMRLIKIAAHGLNEKYHIITIQHPYDDLKDRKAVEAGPYLSIEQCVHIIALHGGRLSAAQKKQTRMFSIELPHP